MHNFHQKECITKVLKRKDDVKPFIENYTLKVRENEFTEKQCAVVKEKQATSESTFAMDQESFKLNKNTLTEIIDAAKANIDGVDLKIAETKANQEKLLRELDDTEVEL